MIWADTFPKMPEARVAQRDPAQYTGYYLHLQNIGASALYIARTKADNDKALAEENAIQEAFWAQVLPVDLIDEWRLALTLQIYSFEQQDMTPQQILYWRRTNRFREQMLSWKGLCERPRFF